MDCILNGCFKCLINATSDEGQVKASENLKESETRDVSKKARPGDLISTNIYKQSTAAILINPRRNRW
jgi:hypothetical protein